MRPSALAAAIVHLSTGRLPQDVPPPPEAADPTARRAKVWNDLRTWAGEKPVFWLVRSLDMADEMLPPGFDYRIVTEVEAPMMFGPGGGGPGMGAMGGPPGGSGATPGPGGRRVGPVGEGARLRLIRISWPK